MTTRIDGGFRPTGNPEADAQNYAKSNGLTLEQAKAELRAKYGYPTPGMTQNGFVDLKYNPYANMETNVPPEQKALIERGIPAEVIIQGDDAVRKFAKEHNINLPPKEGQPQTSVETSEAAASSQELLNPQDKKEWIKNYMETNNCKKSEAYDAFYAKYEKANMSRKEAKAWMKAYSKEHGVSKKEAKEAFESEFGYRPPESKTQRFFKGLLMLGMSPVAIPLGITDELSGGKLGFSSAVADFWGDNNRRYKEKTV